ncbi:GlcG/HbpS family heme-binding protein [Mycobacterium paraterrae]|uniref:Heme-binding protein n=1 Tax=Mycobacterium paraterrae TaxID=577492 RepID=A0ABY3VLP8_9MYCO|nr:heme-binding protein [Mycobacterium paraterrae]UMB69536.1 heme-binding protein [Mycobacterium paraterrae]
MTVTHTSVSLDDAQRVIAAGLSKAEEIASPSNIAVVDAGGNLVAHARMDGAWIGSIDISINKAFTARALDISTEELAANAAPGNQFYGIHVSNRGRIMIFAGGIPLQQGGQIVGAVGVSGGTGDQDKAVAQAAANAFAP